MKYTHVMFDLDGTLLNTLEDLADSGNAALKELGLPVHPVECYRYFVGNGVHELMKRLLPPEELNNIELGKKLLAKYTAQYNNRWHNKTRPYDGMVEALHELKAAGATLYPTSSPKTVFITFLEKICFLPFAEVETTRRENPLPTARSRF